LSFSISSPTAFLPPEANVRRSRPAFPGKDGGRRENLLSDVGAREFAELESPKTKAQRRDRPDPDALASERRGRASGEEKQAPVGNGPGHSTNGGAWRNRARGLGL